MKIEDNIKIGLLQYIINNIHFQLDSGARNDIKLLIYSRFIDSAYEHIKYDEYTYDRVDNTNINKLINFCLDKIDTTVDYYNNSIDELKNILSYYNIEKSNDYSDIVCNNKELYELCKYIVDGYKIRKNSKSDDYDPGAEEDFYIFQHLIAKIFNNSIQEKIVQKASEFGQQLQSDIVTIHNNKAIILDAKFRDTKILIDKSKGKRIKSFRYYSNSNRFQMSSYITALAWQEGIYTDNIHGIIVHAVTSEMYNKYKEVNHQNIDIGPHNITIELIVIDRSADDIINQIQSIKDKYIEKLGDAPS